MLDLIVGLGVLVFLSGIILFIILRLRKPNTLISKPVLTDIDTTYFAHVDHPKFLLLIAFDHSTEDILSQIHIVSSTHSVENYAKRITLPSVNSVAEATMRTSKVIDIRIVIDIYEVVLGLISAYRDDQSGSFSDEENLFLQDIEKTLQLLVEAYYAVESASKFLKISKEENSNSEE